MVELNRRRFLNRSLSVAGAATLTTSAHASTMEISPYEANILEALATLPADEGEELRNYIHKRAKAARAKLATMTRA
ncbi:hypothetical protein EI613_09990 [Azospirillum sp. 412522]|nr:hypothetical protein [Azospirillum sp. 412522]MBY6262243.1 hypothetical protein [Azospirillum sp. 412522]